MIVKTPIKEALTKEAQDQITPKDAIEKLQRGNARFISNLKSNRDLLRQVNETSDSQYPFAFILSCIDSRTSAELIFDQGLGDVFSCRIAGNILNEDILGSMEFACKVAGSKLVMVLGHTGCGAIKGACDHVELGNLTSLLQKVEPAIAKETTISDNRTSSNEEFVNKVTELNIRHTIERIEQESPIIKEMHDNGEIAIVAGMYDVGTGKVDFYEYE